MVGQETPLSGKTVTFWACPAEGASLSWQYAALEASLEGFYSHFPEYQGTLQAIQSPAPPHHAFIYAATCDGVLPHAAHYLWAVLQGLFPKSQILTYGRPDWPLK